ncbi:MAG TPA: DUF5665 domain-containing protein [Patescibacteria group bacterium]|nr:DUF5665 domain-containing protein [Patescibacteria group bacterium]
MTSSNKTPQEYEKMGHMVEDIFLAGAGNIKRLMWLNFLKGIAYGLGIFVAGTIIIGLVLWILSLFNQVPVVGPFVVHITHSLK